MKNYTFEDLKEIIDTLVSENGCPWDKVQTHESLKPYIIEESYEVIEAINNKDNENMCEELGDVLLQVFLHSAIAEKNGEYTLADVVNGISEKMIRRHPHIFSDGFAENADDVLKSWEEIKKEEKKYKNNTDVLKSIPKSLPAIIRFQKISSKAQKYGFENATADEVLNIAQQYLDKLKNHKNLSEKEVMEILGDIFAQFIIFSQIFKINAEFSLTNATEKFINRFEGFENKNI